MSSRRPSHSLLQNVTVCLMRLSESRSSDDVIAALSEFLLELATWHAVDIFAGDGVHRRLTSHRCPRSFAPFVTRLGFTKRPDGSYPGTFAHATLLLVKAADPVSSDRCLVCAIGLEKMSPLNDGMTLGCLGVVAREALSRVWSFDSAARRAALIGASLDHHDQTVLLIDAGGRIVERHPDRGSEAFAAAVLDLLRDAEPRARPNAELTLDGRVYDVQFRTTASEGPLSSRYLLVHGRQRSAAPRAVAERLKAFGLSKRESQVAELVFTGRTNQLIADTLFISRDTVKTHCRRIFGKLGITRRTEFLRVAGE
jgi:DNA-binding CsgD family transcriptional regulator